MGFNGLVQFVLYFLQAGGGGNFFLIELFFPPIGFTGVRQLELCRFVFRRFFPTF